MKGVVVLIVNCLFIACLGCTDGSEAQVVSIEPYCWCFLLAEGCITYDIEDITPPLCMTYSDIKPDQILSDKSYAKAIIKDSSRLSEFQERVLKNSIKSHLSVGVDSRLVFLIRSSDNMKSDTFVYINNEYYWLNGSYYKSNSNDIDSILYEIGKGSFCYCEH
ncbi:hypothetical protein SapgrDRAFT_0376 [Saprospira grandis DSM 2844]|uniref:Lipoprotein n=1 Tax=Saprospira grandis DSM 2844 TaxID=694433 RepID=J0P403_9BACT|nr:hypothetical protein [Saprospira grandis]EJF52122.1 hypothetical protein SapgrDRAFT_0376 [Saprospira grandis DSM 2844]